MAHAQTTTRRQAHADRAASGAVSMRGITKGFEGVLANDAVDLDLYGGEIHALLGENGAGKTTLMSILAGLLTPDAGELRVGDEPVAFRSPRDALRRGIGMVPQHPVLVPNLTIAENLVLGHESSWKPRLRHAEVGRWAADLCEQYGTTLDSRTRVDRLSIDQVQQVEILRLLGRDVRTLILDEPTAILAEAHVEHLFDALTRLRDRGCAIVIVTHKLKEVMEFADRATVLRHGRRVAVVQRPDFDDDRLASAVVGGELRAFVREEERAGELPPAHTRADEPGPAVLRVSDLVVEARDRTQAVDHLSFDVRAGEIVGLAGVEGNGQGELTEALAGVRPISGGSVCINGTTLHRIEPRRLDRLGVGVVSGDRHRWDVVSELSVAENLLLSELVDPRGDYARWGFLLRGRIDSAVSSRIERFDIRPAEPGRTVEKLSGGNQQRIVLARELSRKPVLLIAAYPTRGLDVAAVKFVHGTLRELRSRGTGILLVSADRDELFALSDRVGVLYRGRLSYQSSTASVDRREFGRAMVGLARESTP